MPPVYEQFEGIIPQIARRLASQLPPSIDREDLAQVGRIALMQACRTYDPSRAATFPAYIRQRVRGAMLDAVRGPEYRESIRERNAVRIDDRSQNHNNLLQFSHPVTSDPFVSRAITGLSGRCATVIEFRYRRDLSQREAAAELGVSQTTVVREEHAAIRQLRAALRCGPNPQARVA